MVYIVWDEYRHQQLHVANTKLPWKPFIQQHIFLDSAGKAQAVAAKATFATQEAHLYLSLCFNLFFFSSAAEEKWEGKAVPLPKPQTHAHAPMHHSLQQQFSTHSPSLKACRWKTTKKAQTSLCFKFPALTPHCCALLRAANRKATYGQKLPPQRGQPPAAPGLLAQLRHLRRMEDLLKNGVIPSGERPHSMKHPQPCWLAV